MNIRIVNGECSHLDDCVEILQNSNLGIKYFSKEGSARNQVEEGFDKKEIYVSVDEKNKVLGFIWIINNGIFHSFPYIHIIAVKEEERGKGIGRKLLKFAEDISFENNSKIFLVVGDFNKRAKKLYEELGYVVIGDLNNLYREGITETLMMKLK